MIDKDIIDHLVFHKSLIDEEDADHRINRYMDLIKNIKDGVHLVIKDPFERSIAIVFELVMRHQLDPWNIDLVYFSKIYLDRIRNEKNIDFPTVGHLIFLAWSILKLQSDNILQKVESSDNVEQIETWLPDEIYQTPEDFDYTSSILESDKPPIQRPVIHVEKRHVSLMELVNAFDKAKKDAELRQKIIALRRCKYKVRTNLGSKIHHEDLGEEICLTWKRILSHDGNPIPISEICGQNDVDDLVTVFISILFLAQLNIIKIYQNSYSEEIYVQNTKRMSREDIERILRISTSHD
jgi:segregation and condensation protein A